MFECHACFRQALRAIVRDSHVSLLQPIDRRIVQFKRSASSANAQRRPSSTSTAVAAPGDGHIVSYESSSKPLTHTRRAETWKSQPKSRLSRELARRRDEQRQRTLGSDGNADDTSQKAALKRKNQLRTKLKYLVDPLKLTNHVHELLFKKKDEDDALELVRAASKSMNCVVGWNHIIQWHFMNGKPNAALKLYNEMKKRDQWPDSYTYTHILRGLGQHWQHPTMLSKALNVYHSMSAENSRVTPRTLHTNMALKICARAGDMDSLWGVASRLPEKGPRSADHVTYSIILNALHRQVVEDMEHIKGEEELARHFDETIGQGRRIWADVADKWRKGDLKMDDALVCAMGRLLLIGYRPRDWDDILSLIEQTEEIPRMIPPLGTPERAQLTHAPTLNPAHVPEGFRAEIHQRGASTISTAARGGEFESLVATRSSASEQALRAKSSLIFAQPTNNTLSLIMEACQKTVSKRAATDYWRLLTGPDFNIKPDNDNFNSYLRVLRQSHSSGEAVRLVCDHMKHTLPERKTFRIAMSACARDKLHSAAIYHAAELIDTMKTRRVEPDMKTLLAYIKFAANTKYAPAISRAVCQMEYLITNPKITLLPKTRRDASKMEPEQRAQIIEFCRRVRECADLITTKYRSKFDDKELASCKSVRDRFVKIETALGERRISFGSEDRAATQRLPHPKSTRVENWQRTALRRRSPKKVTGKGVGSNHGDDDDELAELPFDV